MTRFVIVDDESNIAAGIAYTVRAKYGDAAQCSVFSSAPKALEYLLAQPADILITDIQMPCVSGLSLAAQAVQAQSALKVIFLTGFAEFDYVYSAFQIPGARFLLKSEPDEKLLAAVDSILCTGPAQTDAQSAILPELSALRDGAESEDAFSERLARKLERYIDAHIAEDLSLTALSQVMHFNPSYLSRFYKKVRGKNISDYIQEAKLSRAKALLKSGQHKIKDISNMLGFESPSYFGLFFKRHTGMIPKEYKLRSE